MVKQFGPLVYSLSWEKITLFMDCMDIENIVAKIESEKKNSKNSKIHR